MNLLRTKSNRLVFDKKGYGWKSTRCWKILGNNLKFCTTCTLFKSESVFEYRKDCTNKRGPICAKCKLALWTEWNKKFAKLPKELRKDSYKKPDKKESIRDWYRELKNQPCTDCREKYPYYCMDWDHTRGIKEHNISQIVHNKHKETLLNELKKCDLVCANCHRLRTFLRNEEKKESKELRQMVSKNINKIKELSHAL